MTDSPILISCKQLKKDRKTRFKDFKFFRILRNMDLKVAKIVLRRLSNNEHKIQA